MAIAANLILSSDNKNKTNIPFFDLWFRKYFYVNIFGLSLTSLTVFLCI